MKKILSCAFNMDSGCMELKYANLVLNGDPEAYLKAVTEYKPLD